MAKFFLRKKAGERIANGHPWVFAEEIGDNTGSYVPGDIVEVYSYSGIFIGKGYINPSSKIRIRLLIREKDVDINIAFFRKKIEEAWLYKQQIGYTSNCRVIYGEADNLPGLIIDKYGDHIVIQSLALGIDHRLNDIAEVVQEVFRTRHIYIRNDNPIRKLEGLELSSHFHDISFNTNTIISENGININIDIANGQKTGYYLDQCANRKLLKGLVRDAEVLDVFCYSGSFALHALRYGAKSATGIDNDSKAIELAKRNVTLNTLDDKCSFKTVNAFDELKSMTKSGEKFDVIILDPPPFAINKTGITKAEAAYKEINLRALKLLRSGGYLMTNSSSNVIDSKTFRNIIQDAAYDVKRQITQVFSGGQSTDHSIRWNMPTTEYLKTYVLHVK